MKPNPPLQPWWNWRNIVPNLVLAAFILLWIVAIVHGGQR